MKLNFGHTFAHALEIQNKYSNKLNHGEAVLLECYIAVKFLNLKNLCSKKNYKQIEDLYNKNLLLKNFGKF